MKTEIEIRLYLREIRKLIRESKQYINHTDGVLDTLKWVLEEEEK